MLRRVIQILIWLIVIAYLAMALAFTERMEETQTVGSIDVIFIDNSKSQFIEREDVIKVLKLHGFKFTGRPVDSISRSGVREAVYDIPEVKDVNVFYTPDSKLHIQIWQRKPVVRIKSGKLDFYLDEDNVPLPFSVRYTPKVLVVTGSVDLPLAQDKLFDLAKYIRQDPFLNALIQEIHIDRKKHLEIIPIVGEQRIFMGGPENYERKLKKLMAFYEEALPYMGWNKYSSIDLRFRDQVVCKKIEQNSTN